MQEFAQMARSKKNNQMCDHYQLTSKKKKMQTIPMETKCFLVSSLTFRDK